MAYLRVLRCTQSLGWGLGQGELTGRIWSLLVSLLFLENYIVMKSARIFENQVDVHSVLPCLALITGAWQRVMPSWSSSRRRLGCFQVDAHIFAWPSCSGKSRLKRSKRSKWKSWRCSLMGKPQKAKELNSCNTVNVFWCFLDATSATWMQRK